MSSLDKYRNNGFSEVLKKDFSGFLAHVFSRMSFMPDPFRNSDVVQQITHPRDCHFLYQLYGVETSLRYDREQR